MHLICLIFAALFVTTACTTPISKQSLNLVDRVITFEALHQDPARHIGHYLLLGGAIASVRVNGSGSSELEVVQLPTDQRGRITSIDRSAGRFIALDNTFRDPAIYRPGRLVTLVGQVAGQKTGRLEEVDYIYPMLTVHELHLWDPEEYPGASPVHFGIGFGIGVFH